MNFHERKPRSDWSALAVAILSEVGLTFDDVYDLGRFDERDLRGICHPPVWRNPTSRKRPLIGLSGPVDSEAMLAVLAHECGHAILGHGLTSTPEYIEEAEAEFYAHAALQRHLGREPHDYIVSTSRKYVRAHCWNRFRNVGPAPTKGWSARVVHWCGFNPGVPLKLY